MTAAHASATSPWTFVLASCIALYCDGVGTLPAIIEALNPDTAAEALAANCSVVACDRTMAAL